MVPWFPYALAQSGSQVLFCCILFHYLFWCCGVESGTSQNVNTSAARDACGPNNVSCSDHGTCAPPCQERGICACENGYATFRCPEGFECCRAMKSQRVAFTLALILGFTGVLCAFPPLTHLSLSLSLWRSFFLGSSVMQADRFYMGYVGLGVGKLLFCAVTLDRQSRWVCLVFEWRSLVPKSCTTGSACD